MNLIKAYLDQFLIASWILGSASLNLVILKLQSASPYCESACLGYTSRTWWNHLIAFSNFPIFSYIQPML